MYWCCLCLKYQKITSLLYAKFQIPEYIKILAQRSKASHKEEWKLEGNLG